MPISHNRRLKQPRTKTVIDPITNKRVFYTDYLKMEVERNKAQENEKDNDELSESTTKHDNLSDDTAQGWSSEEEGDESYRDTEDENPNRDTTEKVLTLGDLDSEAPTIENTSDNQMQEQVNKSLSQTSYETKMQLLQARATLRAEKHAQQKNKKKSKKTTKQTTKAKQNNKVSNKSTRNNNKKITLDCTSTPKKSNVKATHKKSTRSKPAPIEIDQSSDASSSTETSNTSDNESDSDSDTSTSSSSSNSTSSSDSAVNAKDKSSKTKKKGKPKDDANYYQPIQDAEENKARMSKNERKQLKKIQRTYRTIYTLKIRITANDDAVKELTKQTKKWFDKIQQIDKKAIVYAFRDKTPSTALMNSGEIPNDYAVYNNFFAGTKTSEDEGWSWATIWLGHEIPVASIKQSMESWSRKSMTWMFAKHLQEKDTVKEYFLLWSTNTIDPEELHKTVMKILNSKDDGREYRFAFAWNALKDAEGKIVRRPKAHKNEKDSYRIVRALHIEVPRAKKDYIYKRLSKLFSTKNAHMLGRRLLMVPIIRDTTPSHKVVKISHLIKKQTQFLTKIKTAKLWDFNDIDVQHPILEKSGRDILMDLVTMDGSNTKVFLGVDYNKKDECYEVTYAKYLDIQVRDILAQLPSLLVYLYEDPVLELLTTAAQESALDAPWDEEKMCAVSKEDREMDRMLKETHQLGFDDSDDSDDSIQFQFEFEDPEKLAKSRKLFNKTNTSDSVSTFNTQDDTMAINKSGRDDESAISKNPSPTKKSRVHQSDEDMSPIDDLTSVVSETRINAVESGLNTLNNMMTAFFKSQNFTYDGTNLEHTFNSEQHDDNSHRPREASEIVPETPEATKASGAPL